MAAVVHAPRRTGSFRSDLVFNVGSQFLLRVVTAVTALYAARVLGPAQFGIWAVLQVLFMYTAQGHLGTANAMMRDVPLMQARGDHESAQRVVNSTWAFTLISSVVIAAAAGVAVYRLFPSRDGVGLVALGTVWLVIVQLQSVFFQFYCRAYSTFKLMAAFSTTQAVVLLPLCWFLIPRFGIGGYVLALSVSFSIIPLAIVSRPALRPRFSASDWNRLLAVGLPMLPGALMLYLNVSLERIVLTLGINASAVGIFVAGAFFFQLGATVWELVIYTSYSRLAGIYGRTGSADELAASMRNIIPAAVWISSSVQGVLYLTLPYVLAMVLPAYAGSGRIAQVLILGVDLWGVGQFLAITLSILDRQKRSLVLQFAFLTAKLVLLAAAIVWFRSLTAVAVGSIAALAVYVAVTWAQWLRISRAAFTSFAPALFCWVMPATAAVLVVHVADSNLSLQSVALQVLAYGAAVMAGTFLLHYREGVFTRLLAWNAAA